MDRPWHLHDRFARDAVTEYLDAENAVNTWSDELRSAFASAAALLREAAPYDDDDLVVEVEHQFGRYEIGWIVNWIDENDGIDADDPATMIEYVTEEDTLLQGATLPFCRPLTIAARDLLDALTGGKS